mmetsp:Transcript_7138/g.18061  ORF Transcript_7138/g.18061 Transcript_7138/m.18061 type:complete len:692 (-) Transcript_7138:80-2155(-)|eukprot:CAMPEP_0177633596 /NCGR_PEP_ID=MMETSP0447-20121125/2923_1 /TAXON_ID=0 /ORGANISM="Stygamoeba regulata, Strain BSH-02190019" /LENGTH=691 /DNA_ID=CAMNT_0019135269 /DNA_START=238 /DNA_END=2313 /DNA_ORIENTATION=+
MQSQSWATLSKCSLDAGEAGSLWGDDDEINEIVVEDSPSENEEADAAPQLSPFNPSYKSLLEHPNFLQIKEYVKSSCTYNSETQLKEEILRVIQNDPEILKKSWQFFKENSGKFLRISKCDFVPPTSTPGTSLYEPSKPNPSLGVSWDKPPRVFDSLPLGNFNKFRSQSTAPQPTSFNEGLSWKPSINDRLQTLQGSPTPLVRHRSTTVASHRTSSRDVCTSSTEGTPPRSRLAGLPVQAGQEGASSLRRSPLSPQHARARGVLQEAHIRHVLYRPASRSLSPPLCRGDPVRPLRTLEAPTKTCGSDSSAMADMFHVLMEEADKMDVWRYIGTDGAARGGSAGSSGSGIPPRAPVETQPPGQRKQLQLQGLVGSRSGVHYEEGLKLAVEYPVLSKASKAGLPSLLSTLKLFTLSDINLRGCDLGPSGIRTLASALSNSTVQSIIRLDLSFNALGHRGMKSVASLLASCDFLQTLDLSDNDMGSKGASTLKDGLLLNKSLLSLNVSGNKLGHSGVKHVAEFVRASPSLLDLDVSFNNITTDGFKAVMQAVLASGSVVNVNTSWNNPKGLSLGRKRHVLLTQLQTRREPLEETLPPAFTNHHNLKCLLAVRRAMEKRGQERESGDAHKPPPATARTRKGGYKPHFAEQATVLGAGAQVPVVFDAKPLPTRTAGKPAAKQGKTSQGKVYLPGLD